MFYIYIIMPLPYRRFFFVILTCAAMRSKSLNPLGDNLLPPFSTFSNHLIPSSDCNAFLAIDVLDVQ